MGRRHLLYLLYTSSVRPTPYFSAPPPPPPPFLFRKGYSQESSSKLVNHVDETINHDRAPSTLEEFKRLEEESEEYKRVEEKKAKQGFASQTVDKLAADGAMEAVAGDGGTQKESFKEPVGVGDFHRTGGDP